MIFKILVLSYNSKTKLINFNLKVSYSTIKLYVERTTGENNTSELKSGIIFFLSLLIKISKVKEKLFAVASKRKKDKER